MRSTSRPLLAVILPLTALALAGCGGSGSSQATATPSPAATSAFQVTVGDCFNVPDDGTRESVTRVEKVSCGEPHTYEAYSSSTLTDNGVFPGAKALRLEATGACTEAFEQYTGQAPRASSLGIKWFVPNEDSWAHGDREILCLLTPDEDGAQTTGSARSGGGAPATASASPTAS